LATLRGGLSADDLKRGEGASFLVQMLIISVTLFPYGFTIGVWRDPLQGVYAGLKFPLVVILATLFNGFINGMLGKLYGASLSLHEAMRAISTSFIIASILLGSLSPVFLFLAMSAPPLGSAGGNDAYALILLGHVAAIAVAGIVANLRLYSLIRSATADNSSARRVL